VEGKKQATKGEGERKERTREYLVSLRKAREAEALSPPPLAPSKSPFRADPRVVAAPSVPTRRANEVEKIKAAAGDH